jgi:hypothetical protein
LRRMRPMIPSMDRASSTTRRSSPTVIMMGVKMPGKMGLPMKESGTGGLRRERARLGMIRCCPGIMGENVIPGGAGVKAPSAEGGWRAEPKGSATSQDGASRRMAANPSSDTHASRLQGKTASSKLVSKRVQPAPIPSETPGFAGP